MKIVFAEPITGDTTVLADFAEEMQAVGHQTVIYQDRSVDEKSLISRIRDAEILVIVNQPLSETVLRAATHLKMIAVAFTGTDHVDQHYCSENQIQIINAAGYSTVAVAELTIGMMISGLRKFSTMEQQLVSGSDRQGFLGNELCAKTVGIMGTGAIGMKVCDILKTFGCRILAYSRTIKKDVGIEYTDLDTLLKKSDIISMHTPLTAQTENLINSAALALMKPSAFIINTARGKIIDIPALAAALKEGRIAGAAIDVYENEPPLNSNHPLISSPNVLLLPHIGYATREAIARRTDIVLNNLRNYLK